MASVMSATEPLTQLYARLIERCASDSSSEEPLEEFTFASK